MKKIKWGVIGTAGIARSCTIPGMQQADNCELYAIAGRNIDKAEQFKEAFGFEKAYGSYKELLDDPEVEAVYIALPNTLHYEWAVKAMQSGKHVLCEKPLAPSEQQVKELFDTAKENHVYLMEAFAYLHSPYITAIRKEIEEGTIGEVRYIDSAFITSDYKKENIRMRRETLGGCTYDLGVYSTSLTLVMMNEEPENIKASAVFSEEQVDKLTSVVMEFAGGKKAAFTCGMTLATEQDRRLDRLEIDGTKGSITGTRFAFNGDGELSYTICTADGREEVKTIEVPQNYRLEAEQFGRCITEGEMPAVTEEFSVKNARIVDRILKEIGY